MQYSESYNKYRDARDKAWRVLIDCHVVTFPVDLDALAAKLNIRLITYTQAKPMLERLQIDTTGNIAIPLQLPTGNYVLYDDTIAQGPRRFAVAHEIGHIVMQHITPDRLQYTRDYTEPQAIRFAANLLMPAIICHHEQLSTAHQIKAYFDVSDSAAQSRAARIAVLEQRNKWLTSPLEREYYRIYRKNLKTP